MNLSFAGAPDAAPVIEAALDAGMTMIDTADVYAPDASSIGHNERIVAAYRERAFIATKGGVRREGERWYHDGRPEYLRAACEASLSRLGRIDLYYLHAVDRRVPIEESVGELARLRNEGKIGAIGVSNVDRAQLVRALKETSVVAVQNELGAYRRDDEGVVALCEAAGVAFVAHSPMGGWRAVATAHRPELRRIAGEIGSTPFAVLIAWLLSRSESIIPIPGASRAENARASAAAASLRLTRAQRAALATGG